MDKFDLGLIGSFVAMVGIAVSFTILSIQQENEKELEENDDICYSVNSTVVLLLSINGGWRSL